MAKNHPFYLPTMANTAAANGPQFVSDSDKGSPSVTRHRAAEAAVAQSCSLTQQGEVTLSTEDAVP